MIRIAGALLAVLMLGPIPVIDRIRSRRTAQAEASERSLEAAADEADEADADSDRAHCYASDSTRPEDVIDLESEIRYAEFSRLISELSKLSGLEIGRLIEELRRQDGIAESSRTAERAGRPVQTGDDMSFDEFRELITAFAPGEEGMIGPATRAVRLLDGTIRHTPGCRVAAHYHLS